MMTTLSLDEVLAYARCPLEWFWERRAGLARRSTPDGLKTAALRQALVFYYEGHTDALLKAMDWVWRDWCDAWGEPSIFDDLVVYATTRIRLLKQIQHDKGRGPSYAERMHRAGLAVLGRRLDEFARAENRVLLASDEQPVGSALGNAFTECRMAIEQAPHFQEPLPSRAEYLGLAVPYEIQLDDHANLLASCDPGVAAFRRRAGRGLARGPRHAVSQLRPFTVGQARHAGDCSFAGEAGVGIVLVVGAGPACCVQALAFRIELRVH